MTANRLYAVITADVIDSRHIESFRHKRDAKLRPLSRLHLRDKLIVSEFAVTAWDEFQTVLSKPSAVPRVVLDLRRNFYPMQLWIALGLGKVSEPRKKPVNQFAGGEAFERARLGAERLKDDKAGKDRPLTWFISGDEVFDLIANTIYRLHDTLLQDVSPKQWETILAQTKMGSQELAAKKLAVNVSTVSRNLRRAHFWQMEETCKAVEKIIQAYF
ncbi:MAG: SatD family protein [Acidobacteriota bacterium]|nr:SatD family protein [Acidobacteriota bacterium]